MNMWYKIVDLHTDKCIFIGRERKKGLELLTHKILGYDFYVSKKNENGPWWYVTYAEFIVR